MFRVFRLSPPRDLKMAVLVCRMWRTRGEDPNLWKWCRVKLCPCSINKLFVQRLLYVEEITINSGDNWLSGDWEAMFKATIRLPRLKMIGGLDGVNLSCGTRTVWESGI